ncbi:MAG: SgcJ/EcaC family oxidoreductase [Acidobacteria bacterium]|nr:SgcJ/EcaC family oxidoreductase [Acidobacteriota bacterium]
MLVLACCIALIGFTLACQQTPPDTRAADETAIRDLDAQWSKAAAAKDAESAVSYYAEDAAIMPPNAPIATGKEAIRGVWKNMVAAPGFAVSWKATKAEVAKSGDLAYLIGTYELTMNDASGNPVNDRGKYVEVWRKEADGKWKVVADTFNSDLPLPAPPEKKK